MRKPKHFGGEEEARVCTACRWQKGTQHIILSSRSACMTCWDVWGAQPCKPGITTVQENILCALKNLWLCSLWAPLQRQTWTGPHSGSLPGLGRPKPHILPATCTSLKLTSLPVCSEQSLKPSPVSQNYLCSSLLLWK